MTGKTEIPKNTLYVPEDLRPEMKETLGEVIDGQLPNKYQSQRPLITVGDVVTETLVQQEMTPDVSIIDGKTRRGDYEGGKYPQEKTIYMKNPPGMIVEEAWQIVQRSIESSEPVIIEVDGEEDLLSLVAIVQSPLDALVIYGIPEKGMIVNQVDEEIKEKTWEVINKMKTKKE